MSCGGKWVADDPAFAREQIEKMIASGELTRDQGEELLRMRYRSKEPNVQGNPIARCDDD